MKSDPKNKAKEKKMGVFKQVVVPLRHMFAVAVLGVLSLLLPIEAAHAIVMTPPPTPPLVYKEDHADLTVKVRGGNIVIQRGFVAGKWYSNWNWASPKITYDSNTGAVQNFARGTNAYANAGAGVWQDGNTGHVIRQVIAGGGFRWSDHKGNWIEYDVNGNIQRYGDKNNNIVTFQYTNGVISGILDPTGTQVLWFDYSGTDLIDIYDASGRKVQYTWTNHQLTSVIDVNGNTWTYGYDAAGNPTSFTDPLGRVTTRTWASNGRPLKVSIGGSAASSSGPAANSSGGVAMQSDYGQTYNANQNILYTEEKTATGKIIETWLEISTGRLLREDINGVTVEQHTYDTGIVGAINDTATDARGLKTATMRDQWNNIIKIVYPDGTTESTSYDPTYSNILKHTDAKGVITQYSYDSHGNLLSITGALGLPEQRVITYTYDQYGNALTETRKGDATTPDAVSQYAYDSYGNITQVTDPEGGVTTFTYDVAGNPISETNARRKGWKYGYDASGKVTSVTDPLNRTTMFAYDKAGLPASITDPAGNTSQMNFDATGHALSVTDPYGASISYSYDVDGNRVSRTDAAGHTRKFTYDLDGRLSKYADGNGNVTQFTYGDAASGLNRLLVQVAYPTFSKQFKYDTRNRVTQVIDNPGSATAQTGSVTYDGAGNVTTLTDPASRSTIRTYNAYGQPTQITDPIGGITQYSYDARGNLVSVTDAKGNIHQFAYDRIDRMVMEIRPLGQTIIYVYDAVGNLVQVTDPKGQVTQYVYDDSDRRVQEKHFLTAGGALVKTISYTWNVLDKLTGYNDGTTVGTYTYDAKQLRRTGESVNYGSFSLSTAATWNALNQKASVTYPDGATYSYTYDGNNQISTLQMPTGAGTITWNSYNWTAPAQLTLPGGTVETLTYDPLMRPAGISVKDPYQTSVMGYLYTYDITDNIIGRATELGNASFTYDNLDRVAGASYTTSQANESYGYDAVHNRVTSASTTSNWTYDGNNELTSAGTVSYTYDANGNTVSQVDSANPANNFNYVYDTDNRLTEVHDGTNALIASYTYDPFGRRLGKSVANGTSTPNQTWFFYSDEGLITEADGTGAITKSYGYVPGSAYTTNPLFVKVGTNYYYYLNDTLGTPQKLITQNGTVVWSALYDSYGSVSISQTSTLVNNLRFPGQYFDAETGLHNNWMRYYSPATGRYVTSDPIGLEGGVNLYAYVGGNPVRTVDPSGLKNIKVCLDDGLIILYDDNGDMEFAAKVATGCPDGRHATKPGKYKVSGPWQPDKTNPEYNNTPWSKDWRNPYGPYFMPITEDGKAYDGVGIHGTAGSGSSPDPLAPGAAATPKSWFLKCSHGCVRLGNATIRKLHDLLPNPKGTKVSIENCLEDPNWKGSTDRLYAKMWAANFPNR